MSLVKKICLGFLVVLLLLIGGLAFLIGTTTGLHMVINGAARWVPGWRSPASAAAGAI